MKKKVKKKTKFMDFPHRIVTLIMYKRLIICKIPISFNNRKTNFITNCRE